MSGPVGCLIRKVKFTAYKQSGKWYAQGYAWIDPMQPYHNSAALKRDIDSTNDQLVPGALLRGDFYITVDDTEEPSHLPFVSRLIHP